MNPRSTDYEADALMWFCSFYLLLKAILFVLKSNLYLFLKMILFDVVPSLQNIPLQKFSN